MNTRKLMITTGGCILSLSLFACAHDRGISAEQLSSSEAPARAAEEAGAETVPNAALYLKLAREQIAQAHALAAKGDERVPTMLARAAADAELALALAQEKTIGDEAQAALDEVEAIKKNE